MPLLSLLVSLPLLMPAQATVRLEAEDAILKGATVSQARPGFSGRGFATGFQASDAQARWKLTAKAGVYTVRVGFATPSGNKGFDVEVNGRRLGGMFPDSKGSFSTISAGRVELREGENEVAILRGWGFYDLDFVELTPSPKPRALRPVPSRLVNPATDAETRKLFNSLRARYGKTTLAGQYGSDESDWVKQKTGNAPAVLGGDFMDYSPSRLEYGADPKNATESYIRAAKSGQILTLSWHWNAPKDLLNRKEKGADGKERDLSWYKGFYTEATTFDLEKALRSRSSTDYLLLIRDIDAIAVQLKKLQAAKIPVLWRPLHEAEGAWFWWGAKGPRPCKELWRIMFDRLTKHHKLNNLIWVWNSAAPDWYPGDEVVDVVSIDAYPSDRLDALSGSWDDLVARFDGKKLLALAEFPGAPDVDRMFRFGVRWSYFVSWTGSVGPKSTEPGVLARVYSSSRVTVLGELGSK